MSSSIEPEFNPPDDLTKEQVINLARHYVNYWKVEAEYNSDRYWRTIKELMSLKSRVKYLCDTMNDEPK